MTHISRVFGVGILALGMLAAGPAIAQTQGSGAGQMPQTAQPAQDFSQAQLQKFADANAGIRTIRQSARKKIQQAGSQQERTQIRKQAQSKMLTAIKDAGMTLKQYNNIGRAAQANPQLAQQIKQMQ